MFLISHGTDESVPYGEKPPRPVGQAFMLAVLSKKCFKFLHGTDESVPYGGTE